MRYSPNINIIIKAIDNITDRLARDFGEIENLQNNPRSVIKFTNSCYKRIKENLANDLSKFHKDYNIEFADGDKVINNEEAKYSYIIQPIDGLFNLSRAIPYFSTAIALEYNNGSKKEIIAIVVMSVANNELYFAEKGSGAFLNNRRIRVSKRDLTHDILCLVSNKELLNHSLTKNTKFNFRLNNVPTLDIAYLASGRADLYLLGNKQPNKIIQAMILMLKEAGGDISEKEDMIILNNSEIKLS